MVTTRYVKQEDVIHLLQTTHLDNDMDLNDVKELLSELENKIMGMPVYITNREDDEQIWEQF